MVIPGASTASAEPEKKFASAVCGESGGIGKGQAVRIALDSDPDTTANGVWVMLTEKREHIVRGVAVEKADYGQNLRIQIGGFCNYINTDGNVGEGDLLVPADRMPGVLTGFAPNRLRELGYEVEYQIPFGQALDDDSGAVLSAAWLFG